MKTANERAIDYLTWAVGKDNISEEMIAETVRMLKDYAGDITGNAFAKLFEGQNVLTEAKMYYIQVQRDYICSECQCKNTQEWVTRGRFPKLETWLRCQDCGHEVLFSKTSTSGISDSWGGGVWKTQSNDNKPVKF